MSTSFADFYVVIRTLLGDNDPYNVFDYQDATIDGAIRSVFLLGRGPMVTGATVPTYSLTGDAQQTDQIDPAIPSGDDFAIIAYESALLLIGGEQSDYSYHTRGLSRRVAPHRKDRLLGELKLKIYEIKGGKESFATVQSFVTWLASIGSLQEAILETSDAPVLPAARLNLNPGLL